MAIDEERRYRLHQRAEAVFGANEATTMMELLPPVGWADVATKHDLEQVTTRLGAELRAEFHKGLKEQLQVILAVNAAMMATMTGIALAVAKLT